MVSVDLYVYAQERLVACVEDWMNDCGGSQVAAQIIMLQSDVTTSQSLNLTTSMSSPASDTSLML